MAIKSPKNKGSGGEREVIELLTNWGREIGVGLRLERNLEQVRRGGADVNGVPGLEIEVKRVEGNGINGWWSQVCRAAQRSGGRPFLCHRKNRQPWRFRVAVLSYELRIGDQAPGAPFWLVADLELEQAKRWFQEYIKQNKELIEYDTAIPGPPPPPPRRP